jgi:FMN phosphatase YigB (HAD superfamily)
MQNFTVSLDVWNTLITFNPNVKQHRLAALSKLLGVSHWYVDEVYSQFKRDADRFAEECGGCLSQQNLYTGFIKAFDLDCETINWLDVRNVVEESFRENPPFIHPELPSVLGNFTNRMRDKYGCVAHIGIATNNNFISGEVIHDTVLKHLDTEFAFHISSVDIECAKPSSKFIDAVIFASPTDKIIHIGDNPLCDNFGDKIHKSIIINNPAHCIHVLKKEF